MRELPILNTARLDYTQDQIDRVFRFERPERLPLFFGLAERDVRAEDNRFADPHMVQHQLTAWGDIEQNLEQSLNGIRWWNTQTLSPYQWAPSLNVSFPQETLLTAFGVPYELFEDGGIRIDWHESVVRDLAQDVPRLEARRAGWIERGLLPSLFEKIRFLMNQTDHKYPLSIPDWQSPLGLAAKLMGVSNCLYAMIEAPAELRRLLAFCADIMLDFAAALEAVCGGPQGVHCGMCQPRGARGILFDDLVSVVTPSLYQDLAVEANDRVLAHFGGGEVHTCGPCAGPIAASFLAHQRITSFDFFFAENDKTRTTQQLLALKAQCRGRVVMNVMGMVFDEENFTPAFVREMTKDGGVIFSGVQGSARQIRKWLAIIDDAA